ncbi:MULTISPECIES: NAD(P)H-dependent glycerol-3-phosphate dehydrogenase [unclassified Fusibacter]|uniref:NAD(P)H-dependent glycerol-3-phosphate dehydrogenase n=1 Tax=unclassified Fusibacter TaxID=2624464 RepID=UPI0010131205|nr:MULTISPECIES: NAD(P)H-dependent glycerol-3-phosphate dehydrogenase [unclassified Fusibacter]MCK8058023.1 NAD(P)H-dependent glycerol-3-phosphate dehydrogenase [Fusibacter sp. A2]NPE20605.1 NAD(P)H-dependent glycerol-3-phosphate dehydrogenase [Fusibacter sp. A1]RXV62812.1 NAD(P)H-dependent glycerol-3-phosphate dehydrogenase [Fusibacter sp. A1]
MKTVGILGAGSWATAIARILLDNGHTVIMWGRNKEHMDTLKKTGINERYMPGHLLDGNITFTSVIEEATRDVDYLVNTIPTQGIRSAIEAVPFINPETVIINVSKGLEIDTLKPISKIFEEFYPTHTYAVLSGPSHAEEVVKQMPTTLVAACRIREVSEAVQDLFMTPYIRVYAHPDVIGVEISSALKNIIAVAAGICDGLGYGDNANAALITRGIAEIKRLGLAMGAMAQTFDGLAGIGDLIVTCTSMHSRNRRCGMKIGQGMKLKEAIESIGMAVEGAYTIKAAYKLMSIYHVEMPIVEQLYKVLYEDADPVEATKMLMLRAKKHEIDDLISEDMWH